MPDEDWTPAPDAAEQTEEMLIGDLDLIGELTHPLRSRILHRLRTPRSVAELAESLDLPVTRLYHHINRLEEIGMISVVATRRAGVVTERQYRNVARGYRMDEKVIAATEAGTFGRSIGSLFDVARTEFQREVEVGALAPDTVHGRATLGFSELTLDDAALAEFLTRLHELLEHYTDIDERRQTPDGTRFRLFIAGFPLTD